MIRNLEAFPLFPNAETFIIGLFAIIGSTDTEKTGLVWRHLSVSRPDRYPSWDEIVNVRYQFFREESEVVMFLPPRSEYVNFHNNCFHLWERLDGRIK